MPLNQSTDRFIYFTDQPILPTMVCNLLVVVDW